MHLTSIAGKHRLVESVDPSTQSTKYLLTNELTWDATKIVTAYSCRWVIEEFFRNAKQLTDMEGAMLRSEPGVTLALCLVFWLDFLLHRENTTLGTAGKLSQGSVTIPSIVRQAQYTNLEAFVEKIQQDHEFVTRWMEVEKSYVNRPRKSRKELISFDISDGAQLRLFAQQYLCHDRIFYTSGFRKVKYVGRISWMLPLQSFLHSLPTVFSRETRKTREKREPKKIFFWRISRATRKNVRN